MHKAQNDKNFMNYLERRLENWAKWFSGFHHNGLGYHSHTLEYILMTTGVMIKGTTPPPLPCDEEAEEIENLVTEMAKFNEKMALALRLNYFNRKKSRERSEELDVSATRFRIFVDMAKQWLAGRLTGMQPSKDFRDVRDVRD